MVLWRAVSASDILRALARLTQPDERPAGQADVLPLKLERVKAERTER